MKAAEQTPPLPDCVEDLAAWHVFADQLIERGDRLGPYLAYELSLGAEATKEELATFHKKALRICRVPRQFAATWMLGQVRGLTITRDDSKPVPWVTGDDLLTLRDLLPTAPLQHLERLVVGAGGHSIRGRWHMAMAQLPRSCRSFELHTRSLDHEGVSRLMEGIPATVETIRLLPHYGTAVGGFASDRLAWLDLRGVTLTRQLAHALVGALGGTSRVKVRVGTVSHRSALEMLADRAVVGDADDAVLMEEAPDGAISLLERTPLDELQARHGIVTARAQVVRGLVESFRLGRSSRGLGDTASWTGDAVISRAEGAWSVRSTGAADSTPSFSLNGTPLTAQGTPLQEGDRLEIDGRAWTFSLARARPGADGITAERLLLDVREPARAATDDEHDGC